ncbi:MAG: hypothetical protein FJW27_12015 [Acidimicrobiia bacterium]|nr:hypothetical protein [Acidimicrobiia bacterium]
MNGVEHGYPSLRQVAAIVDTGDPVRRNYRITVGYWQIARAMRDRLPGGATWCAFGTWASRQAGTSIRKEDLERAVARGVQARLEHRPILHEARRVLRGTWGASHDESYLLRLVGNLSQGLPGIDRTAAALATGNALIFGEIGREFSRYLMDGASAFGDGLRPGASPEGQDLLRSAFTHYAAAEQTGEAGARAQLILLGNVQVALHEQTVAHPLIREALDSALLDVADTRRRVVSRLDALLAGGPVGVLHTGLGKRVFNGLADELSEELRAVARMVITERLMSIEMPKREVLRLGADVPSVFPSSLATVTNDALAEQLAALDPTPDSTVGSGTADWSSLSDRMHFLADFFRRYQEDPSLFAPPFSDVDLRAIEQNGLPRSS